MNIEALERVIKLIDKDQPIYMHAWKLGFNNGQVGGRGENLSQYMQIHCGTAACAIGHTVLDLWFAKHGFIVDNWYGPEFGHSLGWRSVERFFEITDRQAIHLFSTKHHGPEFETGKQVADRIREFIKTKGKSCE